ncbi:DUF2155 domain-containing protein [Mariprofundus ferrinatatus]|nr:DUF2155 domain-containing protein [Mariprofundus ferrinatatus]
MGRFNSVVLLLLVFAMGLLLTGCEQEKANQIEWQLPLEKKQDPHSGQVADAVPEWAALQRGEAEFVWLEKATARLHSSTVASGGVAEFSGWEIRLLGLATGLRTENRAFLNDGNVDNPAAFVVISRDGEIHYRGWLYQKFPELFGMDDPAWKVWLKGITLRPASQEAHN